MSRAEVPTLRWGIIATGTISSWFVGDLWMQRENSRANHVVEAIGSSSREKGEAFAKKNLPANVARPTVYGTYDEVYSDPTVDIIYIGTPHAFHKKNCLDAIRANKHVLCEKPFAMNATEAKEVFAAAEAKGVFVMEAMWTRFFPLVQTLQEALHSEKLIGSVRRVFCDFAQDMKIDARGPDSRLKNPELGAGALLDSGVYSLTWALFCLDPAIGRDAVVPRIAAFQSLDGGIDVASAALLLYPDGKQGIATTSGQLKTPPQFCRIEGTEGHVEVEGLVTPLPRSFTVYSSKGSGEGWSESSISSLRKKRFVSENPGSHRVDMVDFVQQEGKGFYMEADAVAQEIASGKRESSVMPWAESIRVLEIMDEIRRQGHGLFPVDGEISEG